ncbi:glycosyl hydrolase [Glycomyces mayteni]|uniref:Glycosyl hydrolase n=1 Tax=Glycomyces mayteni TaxID=543887 RepID=A0ABW2D9B8_9ACTN|nr:cellulase family glycosylhydrolase [Glycomyces mayteni]
MRFGVNYTPRVGWFHHWTDFDADEVARDFDAIGGLGADHVRVFPLWPVFQPNPTTVSAAALRALDRVIELAGERGLDVAVDGLQGHLSSFDFLPSWLVSWHRRNMFVDEDAISATARYLETLARAVAAHPNTFAFTVGNEVNQFTGTVHPDPHPATSGQITTWLDRMLGAIRAGAPGLLALHACYDASWYDETQPFTLEHVARQGDLSVVHSWVFNGTAQRFGPDAFETRAHARYMVELARAFQTDPGRGIWAQELGAPRNVLPDASVPDFIDGTVEQLAQAPDLFGLTWWCSHDVSRALGDFPELEYDLGLIDEHGRIKPEGVRVREAVEAARKAAPADASGAPVIDLDPAADGGRAALAPGGAFWTSYMDQARRGRHPRIRLAENPVHAHDAVPVQEGSAADA